MARGVSRGTPRPGLRKLFVEVDGQRMHLSELALLRGAKISSVLTRWYAGIRDPEELVRDRKREYVPLLERGLSDEQRAELHAWMEKYAEARKILRGIPTIGQMAKRMKCTRRTVWNWVERRLPPID